MEHRDYVEKQIDQLGKTLSEILAIFIKLKSEGKAIKGAQITQDLLMSTVEIDLSKLVQVNKLKLRAYIDEQDWDSKHLEQLVDLFYEYSQLPITDIAKVTLYAQTGINLLDIADELSDTFSFKRETMRSMLKEML